MNFQNVEFLISAASDRDFPRKRLPEIGDLSLLGVVSARGESPFRGLELTRYGLVYRMAFSIAQAIFLAGIGRNAQVPLPDATGKADLFSATEKPFLCPFITKTRSLP